MKDHQRVQRPTPSLTDQNAYEVGQEVRVTVTGRIVRIQPAGNGRATLKIDTALESAPEGGQWVYIVTDLGDDVQIEVK